MGKADDASCEEARSSTTGPLVESAWSVNGLDAAAERRIAEVVRVAAD